MYQGLEGPIATSCPTRQWNSISIKIDRKVEKQKSNNVFLLKLEKLSKSFKSLFKKYGKIGERKKVLAVITTFLDF